MTSAQSTYVENSCRASVSPIGSAEVVAGDGALRTWMLRGVVSSRKSCTSVPSRRTAWAESTDERVVGATSIAAPVIGTDGVCTTAVQVAGPSSSAALEDTRALAVEVRQAAAALSARLG